MDFNHSLCWQIKDQSQVPSYIFGTVHQLDSDKIQLPLNQLGALLDETGALCVEVDFSVDAPEFDESMMVDIDSGAEDVSELDPQYRERLVRILESSADGQALLLMLDRIPVSLLTMMVTMEKQRQSDYFSEPDLEIETEFVELARSKGYPVLGLETLEQHSAMITGAGASEVSALDPLKQAIDAFDDPGGIDVFAQYAAQDLNLLSARDMNAPAMIERHVTLAARLKELLSQRALFVLIGAAHLGGEHGLLAMLAEEGFSVTPYPIEVLS